MMRPQAVALSSDGKLLATAGKNKGLVLIDPLSGRIVTNIQMSSVRMVTNGAGTATNKVRAVTNTADLSMTGLAFSPKGDRIFVSNAGGGIWAYTLRGGQVIAGPVVLAVPDANAPNQKSEIPTGLAVSEDGKRLYVAGNLANRISEIDTESGKALRSWDTGVAPQDIAIVGSKLYVSNLGGRRPGKGDRVAAAGKGTKVRVDTANDIACEGSVTVVDLGAGIVKSEILVGLHPSALAVSPNEQYVVVANTGSDTISVIDTRTDQVIEKIWARQTPADLFGAQPNALTFDPSGKRLYVCNGTQNAVAVIDFAPKENSSRVVGLIPVGWFPGAIQMEPWSKTLCVANMKGIGALKNFAPGQKVQLTTRDFFGTVSLVSVPSTEELAGMTAATLENMRYPLLADSKLPARQDQAPRPVPERVGEPSVFKHVIYVIKENRTYDQVLGDMPEGNGDSKLCTFGEKYTPNQHKIAREFVLLDNMYCAGVCSSDGHQWTDSSIANEYVERQLTAGNVRSYNNGKDSAGLDALAWASSGFIWDHALAQGKTFRNYGEWMMTDAGWSDPKRKTRITWTDFWKSYKSGTPDVRLHSRPGIAALGRCSYTNTVGWDLKVPDVMRAAEFIRELHRYEITGDLPDFILLFLPNDHTGGTKGEYPTPGAQVADNDLAFGQIVDALTKTRFWPETCLLAIEDDPQAGWDHVSGYRTTCYVVSPYTKRRQTVSVQYNQTSLMRTMELILGLPPMNQMDATASPMNDVFTDHIDLTPFTSVTNSFPLDQLNPEPRKIDNRQLREDALVSNRLHLDEPDRCPEDVLNGILWRAMKGSEEPYPKWAVKMADLD